MKKTFLLSAVALSATFLLSACNLPTDNDDKNSNNTANIDYNSPEFQNAVEQGIQKFIAKQEADAKKAQEEANKPKEVDFEVSADDDPFLGDANAPVTIVEFSDYECPFCGRHAREVAPKIVENYINTGKVKLVFRDLPLGFHPDALPAAIAANCARAQGDDKTYFEFHDKLYAAQDKLKKDQFIAYAKELNLDEAKFTACLDDPAQKAEVEADQKEGAKYGVQGTPGFFINKFFIAGAFPYETFEKLIEQELAK